MKYDLYLTGTVGWSISADYVKYALDKKKGQHVDILICSIGGYVHTGLEIYELIKNHGDATCHFVGMTASAATFMAMGAKEVKMAKNSLILIHNGMEYIDEWGNMNKEQLDELIKKLQFSRSQLETIDDVIAQIYVDRCGKTADEVKAKMNKAAWIKSSEAKDFGLVDEIEEATSVKNTGNSYNNTYLNGLGLPDLPKGFDLNTGEETPTKSGFEKVVEALKGLASLTSTKKVNQMIKTFKTVMALLAITDGFKADENGNISLTQDQMKALDDKLREQEDACKNAATALDNQKKKIEELTKNLEDSKKQVENLKGAAPASKEENVDDGSQLNAATELWNSIKNAM